MVLTQPDFSSFESSKAVLCNYLAHLQLATSPPSVVLSDLQVKTTLATCFAAVGSHYFHYFTSAISSYREEKATKFILGFIDRLGKENCLLSRWIRDRKKNDDIATLIMKKFLASLKHCVSKGADKNVSFIAEILG